MALTVSGSSLNMPEGRHGVEVTTGVAVEAAAAAVVVVVVVVVVAAEVVVAAAAEAALLGDLAGSTSK